MATVHWLAALPVQGLPDSGQGLPNICTRCSNKKVNAGPNTVETGGSCIFKAYTRCQVKQVLHHSSATHATETRKDSRSDLINDRDSEACRTAQVTHSEAVISYLVGTTKPPSGSHCQGGSSEQHPT